MNQYAIFIFVYGVCAQTPVVGYFEKTIIEINTRKI